MRSVRSSMLIRLANLVVGMSITVGVHAGIDPMKTMEDLSLSVKENTAGMLNLSGYINGHYMKHQGMTRFVGKDLNTHLLQIREASVFADILIKDYLVFSTELEMSLDFSDEEASGRDDAFEALLNYFYFDYQLSDHLGWDEDDTGTLRFRVGRILVPFLSYNENKPSFKQTLMSQPFTAWQIAPVNNVAASFQQFGWTDVGLSINWSKSIGDAGLFDIKASVINGLGSETAVLDDNTIQIASAMSMSMSMDDEGSMDGMDSRDSMDSMDDMEMSMMHMGSEVMPTVRPRDGLANAKSEWDDFSDVNDNKAIALKMSYASFSAPLEVGFSFYQGEWDADIGYDLTMMGLHMNYTPNDWSVKVEWVQADVEQGAGINVVSAMGPDAINNSTGSYTMSAWSIEGAYTAKRYGPSNRNFLTLLLRLDDVVTNDEATFSPFNRSRTTVGLEWGFLHNMRLRAEYQLHELRDYSSAPAPYISAGGEETISMGMLSLIAYF